MLAGEDTGQGYRRIVGLLIAECWDLIGTSKQINGCIFFRALNVGIYVSQHMHFDCTAIPKSKYRKIPTSLLSLCQAVRSFIAPFV